MIFDLDPGEGVAWKQIQEGTELTRSLLEDLGLATFLKTSGGKGLHVVVPIAPKDDWDTVKALSKAIVEHMATVIPERFVAKSGPKNRVGKIFVDYLRNGFGATTACAWSAARVRAWACRCRSRGTSCSLTRAAHHWTISNTPTSASRSAHRPLGDYSKPAPDLDGGDEGVHVVDATMFWSPTGGGVRRYLQTKHAWLARQPGWRHTIAVPGSEPRVAALCCPRSRCRAAAAIACRCAPPCDRRVLRRSRPDLIEAGDPYRRRLGRARRGAALGIPAVAYCHSNIEMMARLSAGRRFAGAAARAALRAARLPRLRPRARAEPQHARPSARLGRRARRLPAARRRHHGLPSGARSDVATPQGLAADARVLVYAGRFAPEKHLDVLADAVARLGAPYAAGRDRRRAVAAAGRRAGSRPAVRRRRRGPRRRRWRAPTPSSTPATRRPSACRRSRRWPAARRSSRATPKAWPSWSTTRSAAASTVAPGRLRRSDRRAVRERPRGQAPRRPRAAPKRTTGSGCCPHCSATTAPGRPRAGRPAAPARPAGGAHAASTMSGPRRCGWLGERADRLRRGPRRRRRDARGLRAPDRRDRRGRRSSADLARGAALPRRARRRPSSSNGSASAAAAATSSRCTAGPIATTARRRGLLDRLRRTHYTRSEGEFWALPEAEATRRIDAGIAWFAKQRLAAGRLRRAGLAARARAPGRRCAKPICATPRPCATSTCRAGAAHHQPERRLQHLERVAPPIVARSGTPASRRRSSGATRCCASSCIRATPTSPPCAARGSASSSAPCATGGR